MNLYHNLLENPLFFKWIFHPSPEINAYWDHYLEQNPDNAQLIRDFKAGFEKHLSFKKYQLSDEEKKDLAYKILKQLELKDKQSKSGRIIFTAIRYAAVALIFLMVGSAVSYFIFEQNHSKWLSEMQPPMNMNIQEPTLILDDRQEIVLQKGESNVEYSDAGEIIVDRQKITQDEAPEKVNMNTLIIPYGNKSTITLADGTKVWLNAGSRLIYPSRFVDSEREVFLVGEAFFNVSKNEEQPFVVKTPDIQVEVLGTQFNISAYPEEENVQTVLTEGSIQLEWTNGGLFDRNLLMEPGQLVTANKREKTTKTYQVNTDNYTSWTEGYLTFNNSDLSRVVKKLERFYNIRVRYKNPLDGTIKISGKLDVTSDAEEVFSYMNALTGLDFIKLNDSNYMIN